MFQPFEFTLVLAVILLVAEVFAGAFVFLSFSVALFCVATAEFFFRGFSLGRDTLIFVLVTGAVFIGLRLIFRTKGDTKVAKGDVNEY